MLFRKLRRDLWSHKGAYIASMVLVLVGILIYNLMSMLHDSFEYSLEKYYTDYNIAGATLKVNSMPLDIINQIAKISEIKQVEGRLEKRVRLLDNENEVIFHFISYDYNNENRLNDIELIEGRMPSENSLEIIIGNNYYKAKNIKLGDNLPVIINGKKFNLKVVGYGRSPEFVYAKKNDTELISDPKTFDIAFMPYKSMSEAFSLENQINNVAFSFYNNDGYENSKTKIKDIAYRYGIVSLTSIDEQISHLTTKQKLDGIGSMTTSVPIMFLLISGSIIYIVLKRIIEQERTQIGVLKACGISDFRILIHYLMYALLVGITGGAIGAYIGISTVPTMIELMGVGFNMPFITAGLYRKYIINSIFLSLSFSLFSGYIGAKNCLKLDPATAMKAPVSKESQSGIIDKFYFLFENSDIKIKLALRNMIRNKGRTLFIIFGISITSALLTFPVSMNNMYEKMLFDQFEKVEIYDMKISFNRAMHRQTMLKEISSREGITLVEPQMILPVELKNKWKKKESAIISIPVGSKLYNLYNSNGEKVDLNYDGLTLSHWLAKDLDVKVGDYINISSQLFRNDKGKKVIISQIIPQYIGINAYMNIDLVSELLEGRDIVNSLMVNGSKESLSRLEIDLKKSDVISTIDYSEDMANVFNEYMQQTTAVIWVLVIVGMVIGFSVIYVSLTISLSERNRELATMLVVGLSEGEVHEVLLIEQFIAAIFGIILGVPMGKALLSSFAKSSSTDFLIMPSVIPAEALLFSIVTTIIAIIIPQIIGRKKIRDIIVTESLNSRE